MEEVLLNYINDGYLDNYLDKEKKEKLIQIVKKINKRYLYKTHFHGLHHSEKVLLNAYLLGIDENLDDEDMQILIDAALYHDIGRENDFEDEYHGLMSANKIEKVITNDIYKDKDNLAILKAICDFHSRDDKYIKDTAINHDIPEKMYNRYVKLAIILKDADALDRKRFMKTCSAALKEKYLRLPYSKQLVDLAEDINAFYRDKISEHYFLQYSNESTGEINNLCYHGIGCNFFRLKSILQNGILSSYAQKKKQIGNARNFNGNNNELWISVATKNGNASKIFVENGISFEILVSKIFKGIKDKSLAQSKGLPIDSDLYDDEGFVFYEIPVENINKVKVNPNLLNMDIGDLNYINGSGNVDSLTRIVNEYLQNIREECSCFPDVGKVFELLNQYNQEVVKYEKLNSCIQEQVQTNFFSICDKLRSEINSEIQSMIKKAYQQKFNCEKVTLGDVITYIFKQLNIDYYYDKDETKFNLKSDKIKLN